MKRFALVLAVTVTLMVVVSGLSSCSSGTTSITTAPAEHVITVTATSETKVVPDMARIGVTVTTQGATAEEAQSRNAEDVNAVLAALHEAGVADESVQTAYADQYPIYDEADPLQQGEGSDDGADTAELGDSSIAGYEMTTRLQISDLAIDQVGSIMETCVSAGATGTDGPEYYSSGYDASYQEALQEAMDDAHAKAEALAKASGVKLGDVTNVTEGYQDTSYRYLSDDTMADAASADAMSISPGQVSIPAMLTVSYAIG